MKLDEYELKGVSQELSDFRDDVTSVVNFGKYSHQVVSLAPTWKAENGETVFFFNGNETRYYYYINDKWNDLSFSTQLLTSWVVFSGTGTPIILDSFGVKSVTVFGVGDYEITWSTAFSNNLYGISATAMERPSDRNPAFVRFVDTANNPSRTAVRVQVRQHFAAAPSDPPYMCLIASGPQS